MTISKLLLLILLVPIANFCIASENKKDTNSTDTILSSEGKRHLKTVLESLEQKLEITQQMFVLCEHEPCKVINSPSWNISMFGHAKVDTIWTIEGVKIYRLVHSYK